MAENQLQEFKQIRDKLTRFMMVYQFALSEIETKIDILKEEFQLLHEYNPIEHTTSRLKTPESIIKKLFRKGGAGSLAEINDTIKDIAGIRIACSFVSDIYRICGMLERQSDLRVVSKKDYIESPKPNGYRSLHLIVEVPVFMSDRQELVCVEVQIRTIAMDFWASLEHKIFYKYDEDVPSRLLAELKEAAETSFALDRKMERLHLEVEELKSNRNGLDADEVQLFVGDRHFHIPDRLLRLMQANAGNEGSKIN